MHKTVILKCEKSETKKRNESKRKKEALDGRHRFLADSPTNTKEACFWTIQANYETYVDRSMNIKKREKDLKINSKKQQRSD